jgi:hypothetical protein
MQISKKNRKIPKILKLFLMNCRVGAANYNKKGFSNSIEKSFFVLIIF